MSKKILHIAGCDKFIPPFIELVKENLSFEQHEFLLTNGMDSHNLKDNKNVHLSNPAALSRLKHYALAIIKMHQAKKVILHGLFDIRLVTLLFFMPWLLKKCYWMMWGYDLYVYQLGERNWKWKVSEFFRRQAIKKMGFLVSGTTGDVDLAREWYGAKGVHIKCFNYPSNIYKEYDMPKKQHTGINILLGNSADPSNNHLEVFDKLEAFKGQDVKIYTPLTYGNPDYAKSIIQQGKQRFGDKFEALTEHMPFNQYLEFLGKIDIAIFNHRRQQGFGNTITLLGLGKKVYLNSVSTLNGVFKEFELTTFDVNEVNIYLLDDDIAKQNIQKVKTAFSKESLVDSLAKWIQ